jgi:hypothetical protein
MQALDVKEMESSSKINLRDVSWWMSIKNASRFGASVIAKFSKEGCISLVTGNGHLMLHINMIKTCVGLPQPKKHTPPK